jgi:DNA-directed RNA polymerase specialized sigma24 family protein
VSMDMGRLPSLLSRNVFRGRASSSRLRNFEDAVVFVLDVEKCLTRLDAHSQALVARITLQEYTQAEAAQLMGQSVRSIIRRYAEVLDRLTGIFLEAGLLDTDSSSGCQDA